MVADSLELYRFRMGNLISYYNLGKAGNRWQPTLTELFYPAISLYIESSGKCFLRLFHRGSDGCDCNGLHMAGIWIVQAISKQGAGSLGHCGPAADPITVCHQWCAVNDDIRTAHGNLGHTDYFYPAHRGVHDFCL